MNKYILLLFVLIATLSSGLSQTKDPVLFEIADVPVHVSEFKYIYEKNNRNNADYSEQTLTEYLELYKKFKLKVQKAKDMKLDTIPVLKAELAGYRRQLAKSYLVDNEVSDRLVREVFDRQHKDRKIAHIFFPLDKYAPAVKIEKAHKEAMEVYNLLKSGADFDQTCLSKSADKSNFKKGGVLGYFASPMPDGFYAIETAMSSMKPGEISEPVKSKLGFHIVKLVEEREARGEIEIAHIMIRKKIKGQTLINAKTLIDSLYIQLKRGANFEELAKNSSQDKKTSKKGGYLGFFGIGKFEPGFEKAAFDLKEDGAFSRVVESKIAFHIVKRISKQDNSDFNLAKKRIKAKIIKDSRFEEAKKTLIERIKKDANFKLNNIVLDQFVNKQSTDFYAYAWKPSIEKDEQLMSFGKEENYMLSDFTSFCRTKGSVRTKFSRKKPIKDAVKELLDLFIDDKAISYEEKNLEMKYPDFKSLMREYEEGILLFEATKINVWDKASKDSTGLANFYANNKSKYVWEERAIVQEFLIASIDEKTLKKVRKYSRKASKSKEKIIKKINKKGEILEVNENIYEHNSSELKGMVWKIGVMSELKVDPKNKRSSFKRIVGFKSPKMKTLSEARGYVIADYQDHLENIWVKQLRLKYPTTLNEKVFKSLIK